MKVLVIIVTYNGIRWIDRCLSALRQSTHPVTTMVIDNNSTDGTLRYIAEHFPEVILVGKKENLGFGQANNVGLRYALDNGYDYVLLLNQDAYLQAVAIDEMFKVADGKNLFSPLHLTGEGKRLDLHFRESLRRADNELLDDLLIGNEIKSHYEVGEVCAACWFMPIDIIRKIGGFNPLFFQYGEDNNYYTRLEYHHCKTFVVPSAHVWHDRNKIGNELVFNRNNVRNRIYVAMCSPYLTLRGRIRKLVRVFIEEPIIPTTIETLKALFSIREIRKSRKEEQQSKASWL